MTHDVFISHSSKDRDAVSKVLNAIESSGYRCWIAPRDIRPGHMYPEEIVEAIRDCTVMVLVYTSNAAESQDVGNEVAKAWKFQKPVIPFRVEDVGITDFLEYYIGHYQWIDAYQPPLARHFPTLVSSIQDLTHKVGTVTTGNTISNVASVSVANEAPPIQRYTTPEPVARPAVTATPVVTGVKQNRKLTDRLIGLIDLNNPLEHRRIAAWGGIASGLFLIIFYYLFNADLIAAGSNVAPISDGVALMFILSFIVAPLIAGYLAISRQQVRPGEQMNNGRIIWQSNVSMFKTALLSTCIGFFILFLFITLPDTATNADLTTHITNGFVGAISGPIILAIFWLIAVVSAVIGSVAGIFVSGMKKPGNS